MTKGNGSDRKGRLRDRSAPVAGGGHDADLTIEESGRWVVVTDIDHYVIDLSKKTVIHNRGYCEPTVRGLRMMIDVRIGEPIRLAWFDSDETAEFRLHAGADVRSIQQV